MSRHIPTAAPAGGRAADSFSGGWRCKERGQAAGVGGAVGGGQGARVMVCRGWMGAGNLRRQFGGIESEINNFPCDCTGLASYCVLTVSLLAIPAGLAAVSVSGGLGGAW